MDDCHLHPSSFLLQKRSNASIPGAADTGDLDVSKPKEVVLECTADGWPLPEYQWYRGKELIQGATESTLALALRPVPKMVLDVAKNNADTNLDSEVFFREQKRFYRCARCKQISKEVGLEPHRTLFIHLHYS